MSDPFLPLIPKPNSGETAHPLFRAHTSPAAPVFSPMSTPSPAPQATAAPQHVHTNPKVTLEKDGDRVTHIRIHCSCGQIIELECAYPAVGL